MSSKILFVYDSIKLFEIFEEIKENLNFEVNYIDKHDYKKLDFKNYNDYLIVTSKSDAKIENCLIFKNIPKKISKLVEEINISFLKNKFNYQSETKVGKYILDLNSRKIKFNNTDLDLTEKECDLILFIKLCKKVNLKEIQKMFGIIIRSRNTCKTYRIRKKMIESFNDNNFISFDKNGYFLGS